MSLRPRLRSLIFPGIAALAVAAADARGNAVFAQGRLEARYEATLGGLPLGKGTWEIDVRDNQFTASLSGATSGLLQVIASAHGTSAVRGTVSGGQPVGAAFASSIIIGQKMDEVRMLMSGRQRERIHGRAADAAGADTGADHRRASPQRHRSDDRRDHPRAGQRRYVFARGLQAEARDLRRPHAL